MDAPQYWPFVHEYSIQNAAVAALQFWMADLKQYIPSNAIDCINTAFFYNDFTQQMWTLPEEVLFGCFMTTLNSTFQTELSQEEEGYECASESFNIPTPLSRAPGVYHVSTRENFSFDPTNLGQLPIVPELYDGYSPQGYRCHSFICHRLVFTSSDEESPVTPDDSNQNYPSVPSHRCAEPSPTTPTMDHFLTEAWDDNSPKNTFQQHLWMMMFGQKIQFLIDSYVFMKPLSWTASVPPPAHI